MTALATTLQAFFTDRLIRQRQVSPHTLAAYRDTLRLLLVFASAKKRNAAIEARYRRSRCSPRRRLPQPPRTAAGKQRAYPQCPACRHPLAVSIRSASPPRTCRRDRARARHPAKALRPTARDLPHRTGTRRAARRPRPVKPGPDGATMPCSALTVQTGLRASELIGLYCADVHLGTGAHVSCHGKGRKQRITPLTSGTIAVLRAWLAERAGQPDEPLFTTRTGSALSRDALEHRLAKYVEIAAAHLPVAGREKRSPCTCCAIPPRCACCAPASTPR